MQHGDIVRTNQPNTTTWYGIVHSMNTNYTHRYNELWVNVDTFNHPEEANTIIATKADRFDVIEFEELPHHLRHFVKPGLLVDSIFYTEEDIRELIVVRNSVNQVIREFAEQETQTGLENQGILTRDRGAIPPDSAFNNITSLGDIIITYDQYEDKNRFLYDYTRWIQQQRPELSPEHAFERALDNIRWIQNS